MDFFFFNMREITAHLCAAADREGKTDDAETRNHWRAVFE